MTTLADLRINYSRASLDEADVAHDPFAQFDRWFKEALAAKLPEPNTMTLATVGADGRPSARIVLIKGVDERGFVFFTNYESRRARSCRAPRAALLFYWIGSSARCASKAGSRKPAQKKVTAISRRARSARASAHGRRNRVR